MVWMMNDMITLVTELYFIPPREHPKTLSLTETETVTGFIFDY